MQAAVYYGANDIRLGDVPEPQNLEPGEVRIRHAYVGICGTDLHEFAVGPIVIGREPHPLTGAHLPQILGHEFSAVVTEIGPGVKTLAEGDRVTVVPSYTCGRCFSCRSGEGQVCRYFAAYGLNSRWGALAEYGVVHEDMCTPLPESVSLIQGALMEPAKVASYAVDRGRILPGGTLLIMGGGPIGALAALYAHASGVGSILVVEPTAARRQAIDAFGVAEVLDPASQAVGDIVADLTGGEGVDAAIDAAGVELALQTCITTIRPRGVVVQAALHTRPVTFDAMALSLKDASIEFTWCWKTYDWHRTVNLVASGRYPVESIVSRVAGLHQVPSAFAALLEPGNADLKLLIDVSPS
jgi:(R,R)-butanediol dehydrogenase / meso-butanediol dehydrogenase / diacetyl reductase